MASGAQHYRKAEEDLKFARQWGEESERGLFHLQTAMIHATLANAAATALNDGQDGTPVAEWSEWREVCAKGTAIAGEGTCPGGC